MQRFISATSGWRAGAVASALLAAVVLAGPAAAATASNNKNLTATAKYSASTEWQSASNNPTFVAAKAFDGDYTSRWNVDSGDNDGSWIAANWDSAVTVNKVVVYEAFDRLNGFRVQKIDPNATDWSDAFVAEGPQYAAVKSGDPSNPRFTIRFPQAIQTKGVRILFTQTNNPPSIFEVEAWNNPAGTLTGTVTDPAAKPIAGATVTAGTDVAVTDASGKYVLTADAGKYNVTAGKFGSFRNRIARGITLAANAPATHDFVLIPTPPNLSLAAKAVSSTDYQGGTDYNAAKANDGILTTRWNSDAGDTDGAFLELQWAQSQTFDKVVIREAIDRIRNYSLQTYDDAKAAYVDIPGASNVNVPSPAGSANPIFSHILATPVTSKRLRLLVNHADDLPSIWELEVSNAPLGTVTGVVTDATTGKPVANATLTSDLGVTLGTTDANGAFNLLLDADDYVVTASASGYFAGAPVSFTLNGGDKQQITLTTPAQGPDIAKTAKASASSEDAAYPASMVNDGDLTTYWEATDPTNQWVAVTWATPTTFTAVQLRGFINAIQSSHLEALAADGKTWAPLDGTTFAPEFTHPDTFFFPDGVTTTSLRYFITATNDSATPPGLSEMLVFNSPIPKPAP